MSRKVPWYVAGTLFLGTFFGEVWLFMLGRLHLGGLAAFGIGLLCVLGGVVCFAMADPQPPKAR